MDARELQYVAGQGAQVRVRIYWGDIQDWFEREPVWPNRRVSNEG